jgi:hypothetical protein
VGVRDGRGDGVSEEEKGVVIRYVWLPWMIPTWPLLKQTRGPPTLVCFSIGWRVLRFQQLLV